MAFGTTKIHMVEPHEVKTTFDLTTGTKTHQWIADKYMKAYGVWRVISPDVFELVNYLETPPGSPVSVTVEGFTIVRIVGTGEYLPETSPDIP